MKLVGIVLGLYLCLAGIAPLQAESLTDPVVFTILPDNGVRVSSPGTGVYDAGAIDVLNTQFIDHVFNLRNNSKVPIEVSDISTSCGCALVMIESSPVTEHTETSRTPGQSVRTLNPGQKLSIRMHIDLFWQTGENLDKVAWVHVRDQSQLAATLEIKGWVKPIVRLSDTKLDYDAVHAGTKHALPVSVWLSPRLSERLSTFTVSSTLPYIHVRQLSSFIPDKLNSQETWKRADYQVELAADAPIGLLSGTLFLDAPPSPRLGGAARQILLGSKIAIQGQVVGEISADPMTLMFGSVQVGSPATQEITIHSSSPQGLKGMRINSSSPLLGLRTVATDNSQARQLRLGVTLGPSAPKGAFNEKIILTTSKGEKLIVPVIAYIRDPLYLERR